ncbi:MAG TPA: ATP synthase F1 subunit delta [Phycisphaerae bacterium]|jgi:F-type H+-transporting ATPase subunit delta|nr:ATP synthase F1 subunit delta [Phycisphaerae bacterium]
MPDNDFQVEAIGEVYAQALINEAQKQGNLDAVTEDVRGIAELLRTNPSFKSFIEALTIGEEERLRSLSKIFEGRVEELTLQVLLSMSRRDRLMFLEGFVMAYEDILRKMSGHVDVELTSALELPAEALERVREAVGRSLGGKSPDLKLRTDSALIGGMMLRIGDTLIDASVATQLEKIQEQLKRKGVGRLQSGAAALVT